MKRELTHKISSTRNRNVMHVLNVWLIKNSVSYNSMTGRIV